MTEPRVGSPVLPTGTVTFLRTDVEGSMRLAQALGRRWDSLNAEHLAILRRVVLANGGVCVRTEGDALFAVFPEAGAATTAAIEGQRALAAHPWPEDAPLSVRMALHTGEAHLAGDDYGGLEVNRAARIAAVGHGGQIILSAPTRMLVEISLTDGAAIRDLGRHALRDLPRPEHLFQLEVPGLRTEFPSLRTQVATIGDLPTRLTSFVGRDDDLRQLRDLLAERRLVTLTGPGGIGKTSVAVELARSIADRFADGAWFVSLAQVDDASLVRPIIARTLGLFDGPDRSAADWLGHYLADRSVLLVLDNFERLLDASGDVVDILEASPASRIVVTSRAPLRVAGEQEYPIPPLVGAATGLFIERAHAVRPGWDPGGDTAVIQEVCALLDGLPLGVELAAARVSLLPVTAIRDRLAARLPLPGSGPRNVPDRQRTLEGAFEWSHGLLPSELQLVLHDLAVFEGGFDLEQAEQVAEPIGGGMDLLDGLLALVEQSLVQRDADDPAGTSIRFRLLATIGTFALARLVDEGRDTAARRRHAEAYLALAEAAAPHMPSADQPRWLDRLTLDVDNIRSAIRWTIDAGEVELALRFVAAMWRYWQMDGHLVEATNVAESALAMPGAAAPTSHRLAAVTAAGGIAYWHGRPADALRWYEEELAVARELGDVAGEADALWNLAYGRYIADDVSGSNELQRQARQLFEEVGDERAAARVDWSLSTLGTGIDLSPEMVPVYESLLDRFERLDDPWYGVQAMSSLAWLHFSLGDLPEASRWFVRGMVTSHSLRDVTGTAISLQFAAVVAMGAERPDDAAVLLGAAEHLGELYGVKPPMGLQQLIGQAAPYDRIAAMLGPDRYAASFDAGRQLTLDEAVALTVRIQDEAWGGALLT